MKLALSPKSLLGFGSQAASRPALFHPVVDFLGLGGASLIILTGFVLFVPRPVDTVFWLTISTFVAHIINNPHFAASYQIFYERFGEKLGSRRLSSGLRARYAVAGIFVPVLLVGFFVYSFAAQDARLLGRGANIMYFLVGWHYVKQGYGCLILDSVMQRGFIGIVGKRIFLVNAYVCWLFAWLRVNQAIRAEDFWGVEYMTFSLPASWVTIGLSAAGITTMLSVLVFGGLLRKYGRNFPINGAVGYVAAIYPWTVLPYIHVGFLAFIPAFHSLQYLVMVGRYQLNRSKAEQTDSSGENNGPSAAYWRTFAGFALGSVLLGFLGFWGLPDTLSTFTGLDDFFMDGSRAIFFCFWIFINVHHYFLDNVMWRRENPDVKAYLFG